MAKKINKRGDANRKGSGRICHMMRPNMRRKPQLSSAASKGIPSTLPSYYDLVMEDIERFLQKANAHISGLRDFLGIDEEAAEQCSVSARKDFRGSLPGSPSRGTADLEPHERGAARKDVDALGGDMAAIIAEITRKNETEDGHLRSTLSLVWDQFRTEFWTVYREVSPKEFDRLWEHLTSTYPAAQQYLNEEVSEENGEQESDADTAQASTSKGKSGIKLVPEVFLAGRPRKPSVAQLSAISGHGRHVDRIMPSFPPSAVWIEQDRFGNSHVDSGGTSCQFLIPRCVTLDHRSLEGSFCVKSPLSEPDTTDQTQTSLAYFPTREQCKFRTKGGTTHLQRKKGGTERVNSSLSWNSFKGSAQEVLQRIGPESVRTEFGNIPASIQIGLSEGINTLHRGAESKRLMDTVVGFRCWERYVKGSGDPDYTYLLPWLDDSAAWHQILGELKSTPDDSSDMQTRLQNILRGLDYWHSEPREKASENILSGITPAPESSSPSPEADPPADGSESDRVGDADPSTKNETV
ncbi:hypothetical protein B0H13DRAFT_1855954 [Mycena leptocephala]|nr:hypothetical protein B0H13DRAFT_1855954 [Mycena leptocephala]